MARLVVSAAAAAVATYFGGPSAGAAAFSATYGLTGFLDPAQQIRGPRIDDLKGTTAEYGSVVSPLYGHPRVAGRIVWSSDKHTIENTESAGGKGGPSTETTTYTYTIDVRILLSANLIPGVRRVWSNGKLVWSAAGDAETLEASAETDAWDRMTVYTGAADQMPDPVEEAALGIENCPAYRGRGSVFIEGLNLGGSGYLPNLTFEIGEGEIAAGDTITLTCNAEGEESTFVVPGHTVNATGYRQAEVSIPAGVITSAGQGMKMAYALGACSIGVPVTGNFADNGDFTMSALFWFDEPYGAFDNIYLFRMYDSSGTPVPFFGVRRDVSDDGTMRRWAIEYFGSETTSAWAIPGTGSHTANGWTAYEVTCSGGSIVFKVAGSPVLGLSRTPVGDSRPLSSVAWGVTGDMSSERFAWDGYSAEINLGASASSSITPAPLEDVLEDLAVKAGVPADRLDFSSCAGKVVRALAVSQVTSARTTMQMLADANQQEFVENGTGIKTVARGGAAVATLTYDELGASQSGDAVEPLPLKRLNDVEIPRQIAITYQNTLADYQNGTEYSDRLLGPSTSVATIELPLGLEPQEAKRIAEIKMVDAVAGIIKIGPVSVTRRYARLEPTDVVILPDHTGSTYRSRILKATDSGGMRTFELELDDATAIDSTALTDEDYESSTVVRLVQPTDLVLIDGPTFRDADNVPMIYGAVNRASLAGSWPGAVLFRGVNEQNWGEVARFTDRTYIGTTTTDLPAWDGMWTSDESSSLTVTGVGTLQSYTDAAIIAGTAPIYFLDSGEAFYARDAEMVTEGTYTLTGLYRARKGTDWAAREGTASGARLVLIQPQGLRRVDFEAGQLGTSFDFRGVTLGKAIGSAETQSITPMGVGLMPYAVAHLVAHDNGDGTYDCEWQRRTRLSCRWGGALGTNVPLGEASESYVVEVFDGASVTSTQTVSAEAATVTASPGDVVRVYQVSAIVGRGYVAEVTL